MAVKYKLSLLIYTLVQLLILLYILMWSLGMRQDAKLNLLHWLLIGYIVVNCLLIAFLPVLSKKQNKLKTATKYLGLLFLALNLSFALKILFEILFHGMDGGFFAVALLLLFTIAALYLAKRIFKL
ncbi:MAG: hypothetical protein EOO46_06235 [Flavobacterium sp.]|nr:MAG: hypothetical protein EOO46_06235 [Flavobacterium sp.]